MTDLQSCQEMSGKGSFGTKSIVAMKYRQHGYKVLYMAFP